MFTGLIETTGNLSVLNRTNSGLSIGVDLSGKIEPMIGDSIAVNGICLTVVKTKNGVLYFDVSRETVKKTTVRWWKKGLRVNIETALKAGDEIGGHFVSGHVDEVGEVKSVKRDGQDLRIKITASKHFMRYLVPQGSVAVDGTSLTVASMGTGFFEIVIIPHTLKVTNISDYKPGTLINLEADMLGKYVIGYMEKTGRNV